MNTLGGEPCVFYAECECFYDDTAFRCGAADAVRA